MKSWTPYHFFTKKDVVPYISNLNFESFDTQDSKGTKNFKKEQLDLSDSSTACAFQGKLFFGDESGLLTIIQDPSAEAQQMQYPNEGSPEKIIEMRSYENSQGILIASFASYKEESIEKKKLIFRFTNPEKNNEYSRIEIDLQDENYYPYFLTMTNDSKYFAFTPDKTTIQIFIIPPITSKKAISEIKMDQKLTSNITNLLFAIYNNKPTLYYTTENFVGAFVQEGMVSSFKSILFPNVKSVNTPFSTIDEKQRLVLCHDNKILFYNPQGKEEKSHDLEKDIKLSRIFWYKTYLVGISDVLTNLYLKIYELDAHCIFGSSKFGKIRDFFLFEWGSIILLRNDKKAISILSEYPNEQKINLLCNSSKQYDIALKIAEKYNISPESKAEILRQSAATKLQKKDYEGAINTYIETIDYLEPSNVITSFLEPQLACYLVKYLEALNQKNREDSLHTILRFNCYVKLNDIKSIEQIVNQCQIDSTLAESFDAEAAVDVLANSHPIYQVQKEANDQQTIDSFTQQAINLAKSAKLYETYCKLLAKNENYEQIKNYIPSIPRYRAQKILQELGEEMLSKLNEIQQQEFTDVISNMYIDEFHKNPKTSLKPDKVYSIFLQYPNLEKRFYQSLIDKKIRLSTKLWNRAVTVWISEDLEHLRTTILKNKDAQYEDEYALVALQLAYEPVKSFLDQFRKYKSDLKQSEKESTKKPEKQPWMNEFDKDKAEKLDKYFKECLIVIYERRHSYRLILKLVKKKSFLKVCKSYQKQDPHIWVEATKMIIKSDGKDKEKFIDYALKNNKIQLKDVLSSSKISDNKFKIIQNFTEVEFTRLAEEIEQKQKKLDKLDEEIDKKEEKITKLSTKCMHFRQTTCHNCGEPLTSPARFFKCGHAFHVSCLGDEPNFCPTCSNNHRANAGMRVQYMNTSEQPPDFLKEIHSKNSLSNIMNILQSNISQGVMEKNQESTKKQIISFYNRCIGNEDEDENQTDETTPI